MREIKILFFTSFFLFSGLLHAKESAMMGSLRCLEKNCVDKVEDSLQFSDLLLADSPVDAQKLEAFESEIHKLFLKLEKKKKQYRNLESFSEYFFYLLHRKILKDYHKEASFSDLVNEGVYNCLTASLLYAYLLEALAIEHEILEYPYHVNILITEGGSAFLLEATNPINGFVSQPEEIAKNIKFNESGGGKEIAFPSFGKNCRKLNFTQLSALLYFNKAVYLFKQGNYEDARLAIEQARLMYPSGRLRDLESYIATHP